MTSRDEALALQEWLRDNAPDCGDNSCLFGGRGKGGMRTNGGCRCFKDLSTMRRIYVERLHQALLAASEGEQINAAEATAQTPKTDVLRKCFYDKRSFVGIEAVFNSHERLERSSNALQAKLDAATRYAEVNPLGGPATMFEAMASRIRAGEDYYAVLRDYGLMQDAAQSAPIDRGDAVNLARTIRETDNIENVTRMGWLSLVDAVLRLDAALAAQSASAAMPKDVLDTLRQARKEGWYEENHGWDKVDAWLAAPSPDEESKR